jgi:hypothetical protein
MERSELINFSNSLYLKLTFICQAVLSKYDIQAVVEHRADAVAGKFLFETKKTLLLTRRRVLFISTKIMRFQ